MSVQLEAIAKLEYVPENEEWEGTLTPYLIQTYPDYFICPTFDCRKELLHRSEVILDAGGDTLCPACGDNAYRKEPDNRSLAKTHYCAPSVCEVNSAMETYLLQLQRHVEQAAMELRGAEERADLERENAPD